MSTAVTSPSLLSRLSQLLGATAVLSDFQSRQRYARSTAGAPVLPLAIVYPENVAQVQQVVQFAGENQVPIHPISCGKNWGYGDACATTANHIILDFARMNRIVEVNEQLAYAVIEPGVTQGQLYAYLQKNHPKLWMDATGAGLNSSFVGNTLDRGFGHTRYGDHFNTTSSMQVVLADGRILNTGFGHYPHAKATRAYRYGVGPFLDGLFVQSNMGILTQIGLWLMPAPEAFSAFFFSVKNPNDLGVLVDALAPLRLHDLLQSTIHIANDLRTISARSRYPWQLTSGVTPLPEHIRGAMRQQLGIGAWNGCGAIYGTKQTVRATQKAVKKALGGKFRLTFLNDSKLALARRVQRGMAWFHKGKKLADLIDTVTPVYNLLKGIPSDDALRGATWRVRGPQPPQGQDITDPLDVHAGIMWVSPVLPTTGAAAHEVMEIIEPIYRKHGFEALVTFTMITQRAMCCVTNIAFDTRETEEVQKARACYAELSSAIMAAGYVPYRTGPKGYAKLGEGSEVFWDVVGELKKTLDPGNLISPGRYVP